MIRIGIVGLGRFAQLHIACLQQMPGVQIVAVCDIDRERVETCKRELSCSGYTNVEAMLKGEQLDALDVLTPEQHHYAAVMAGLQAGCHVFVEKPLDSGLEQAEQMVQAAAACGRLLMVGHVTRFDPRHMEMKRAIERGEIGKIRSIYARRSDRREYFGLYKRSPVVMILGVHDIDQILWVMNELPVEVYARSSSSAEGEDMVCAMLIFRDGAVAMIDCNWLTPAGWPAAQDQFTQIMGDAGALRMQTPDSVSICTETRHDHPFLYAVRNVYDRMEGPLVSELSHFIDCVRTGEPSAILRPEDALNVIRVAAAIIRSCDEGRPIRMDV
ncbi:Gfo/Idh/MocA family protein [Paenibacillus sp. GCM10027626]|uniref:Gfo/Idh/MocA family protein n=1 Tax=Paenibacillus sp. GCM10027626 TaxID=3273411 RepID=UPI0036368468